MSDNKNEEFVANVSLDDGSGNIAYLYFDQDGNRCEGYRPSIVEKGSIASINGMSESIWECVKDGEEQGNIYTVLRHSSSPEDTCYSEYQLSDANRVLINDTLSDAGLGGCKVVVGVTLPTEAYYNRLDPRNPIDLGMVEAKKASVRKEVRSYYNTKEAPIFEDVKVFPEAVPAYVYATFDENFRLKEDYLEERRVLVVDLGRYSDDLALVTNIDGQIDVPNYATFDNGVHKMIDHFHSLLHRNAAELDLREVKDMSVTDLEEIIRRGYIGSSSSKESAIAARKDVSALVKESADYLGELVLGDIQKLMRGGSFSNLDRVVFVGGGANWLGEQSEQWFHTVEIPEDPEMAIVRGVHMLMNQ